MASYNPDFWEISMDSATLDRIPSNKSLWFETEVDRERTDVLRAFFEEVAPSVFSLMEEMLTPRQKEVTELYYMHGKTQEDIAIILNIGQSTVSRHLFGTSRNGNKQGGAIPKLRKAINKSKNEEIRAALEALNNNLTKRTVEE